MDGEVVHALLRLVLDRPQDIVVCQVLDLAVDDHRVDRHGPDRDRAVVDDRLTAGVELAAGGQIHERVGAVLLRPLQLLDFLAGAGRDGAGADVGVDLRRDHPADADRVEPLRGDLAFQEIGFVDLRPALFDRLVGPEPGVGSVPRMPRRPVELFDIDGLMSRAVMFGISHPRRLPSRTGQVSHIRRDHEPPPRDLLTNKRRRHILALRDAYHFRCDDALAGGL